MIRTTVLLFLALFAGAASAQNATLCTGYNDKGAPIGAAESFMTGNPTLFLILEFDEAPPKTVRYVPGIFRKENGKLELVARGNAVVPTGTTNKLRFGFHLAGRAWSRGGGSFLFVVNRLEEGQKEKNIVAKPFTVRAGTRHALLIGISDYAPKGPSKGDLQACHLDALRLKEILIKGYGFDTKNVRTLLSLDATAANIRQELHALVERAGPDDAVVIAYAGHGTQIPDLDGDEPDGWDEALCPADEKPRLMTNADQLRVYISDDELGEILKRFKTRNVTIFFDSCHSGTAVREGEEEYDVLDGPRKRTNKQAVGRKLIEAAEDARRNSTKPVAKGLDVDRRYVFLSAARAWETAMGNNRGGFFSAALQHELIHGDGESWDRLVRNIRKNAQRLNPGQSPDAMGAVRRYPFSLQEAPNDAPHVRPTVTAFGGIEGEKILTAVPTGKVVLLSFQQGAVLENSGVEMDVYEPGLAGIGEPHGRVRITGRFTDHKFKNGGRMLGAQALVLIGTVNRGDHLVPRSFRVPASSPSVGMTFLRNTPADVQAQLRPLLQPMIALLTSDARIRLLLKARATTCDYIVVPRKVGDQAGVIVLTPAMQYVGQSTGDATTMANDVRTLLTTRHDNFTRMNRVSNPSADRDVRVVVQGGDAVRKAGDKITCTGYVSAPSYLYAWVTAPNDAPRLVLATKNKVANDSAFDFAVPLPAKGKGRCVLKVIASERPLNVSASTDSLIQALRASYPVAGGKDFISTDGWGDETMWVEYR